MYSISEALNTIINAYNANPEPCHFKIREAVEKAQAYLRDMDDEYDPVVDSINTEIHGLQIVRDNPDPSRLQIAAMAMQAFISNDPGDNLTYEKIATMALDQADALIAAAKGTDHA